MTTPPPPPGFSIDANGIAHRGPVATPPPPVPEAFVELMEYGLPGDRGRSAAEVAWKWFHEHQATPPMLEDFGQVVLGLVEKCYVDLAITQGEFLDRLRLYFHEHQTIAIAEAYWSGKRAGDEDLLARLAAADDEVTRMGATLERVRAVSDTLWNRNGDVKWRDGFRDASGLAAQEIDRALKDDSPVGGEG